MSLLEMVKFEPTDIQMANLPLDIVVYIKVSVISLYKEDNYDFIRFLFEKEELREYFTNISETTFYDFDSAGTNKERYVSIFEMYSLYNYNFISEYLKEVLGEYSHIADVIIDFYTHDDKQYRLSNLDAIIKLEQLQKTA